MEAQLSFCVHQMQQFEENASYLNKHRSEFCFDQNLHVVKRLDSAAATFEQINEAVSKLALQVIELNAYNELSRKEWKLLYKTARTYFWEEFESTKSLALKKIRKIRKTFTKIFEIKRLCKIPPSSLSCDELEKIINAMNTMSYEYHCIRFIWHRFYCDFLKAFVSDYFCKQGGTICLINNEETPKTYALYVKTIPQTPEEASIVLSLEKGFKEGGTRKLWNVLRKHTQHFETLEPGSKKIVRLWQIHFLCCQIDLLFLNYRNELLNKESPFVDFMENEPKRLIEYAKYFFDFEYSRCHKEFQGYSPDSSENENIEKFFNQFRLLRLASKLLKKKSKTHQTLYEKCYETMCQAIKKNKALKRLEHAPTYLKKILTPEQFKQIVLPRRTLSDMLSLRFILIESELDTLPLMPQTYLQSLFLDFLYCDTIENGNTILEEVSFLKNCTVQQKANQHMIRLQKERHQQWKKKEPVALDDFIEDFKKINVSNESPPTKKKKRSRRRPHKKGQSITVESPSISESFETTSKIPAFTLSNNPIILHRRVCTWFKKCDSPLDFQKLIHSFPLEITRLAIKHGIRGAWFSEKTQKYNPHFSLLGQIEIIHKDRIEKITGIFTDCFDKETNILYHHCLQTGTFESFIEEYKSTGRFTLNVDDELDFSSSSSINDIAATTTVSTTPYKYIIDDRKNHVRYTACILGTN